MRATRAIIHLDNLVFNISEIKKKIPANTRICVPVKADAYGHGAIPIAKAALAAGATHLAVATAQEGVELRRADIGAPILLLGLCSPDEIGEIVAHDITPFVADRESISELSRAAKAAKKRLPVHLKIDTGMGRIGCTPDEALSLARYISDDACLELAGTATHLPVSDSPEAAHREFTRRQLDLFARTVNSIRDAGIDPGIVNAGNSGSVLLYPDAHFDMIRPGIIVYGYLPDPRLAGTIDLRPVMELETEIAAIKRVAAGTPISYGLTWTAPGETLIATLPIGYADGLARALSPGLRVRIGGAEYPIVGRICMDQCMVDLGHDSPVRRRDRATVFGPRPARGADEVASILGTIPYEITCAVNKRVPRVYVEG